ncbi:mannose-1-phosphate guanylyltransferase / mannose-6-phosphate isomerase [Aureimonas jatrophae]|uniref:mannose-1-phosphate guanylyltransferase n=2 Tax=Aureimonas jatrophae TaxID=1166073 RepID=A0A1H0MV69_9HYPH|nr:mannose-1-phosphate guanylyltransferase/mannose-6-phosphate isomerase [Aureimonas jatrophae]SDO84358.1 mannose-1-phosphate guanylyltransferase / mannose-6-phosphate isomerase [Aureimonas jatrophae]
MEHEAIVPVILCGGSGTRLWPVSRDSMPKQFVSLTGTGRSTFQDTVLRVRGHGFMKPVVLTHGDFRFIVLEQLREIGVEADIVLEPERRDSAPAVAVAALVAQQRGAIALVVAADHVVDDADAFRRDCQAAVPAARSGALGDGRIMLLGIAPDHPSTAYGYIAVGEPIGPDRAAGSFEVARFIEKPDAARAAELIEEGCVWNSGNFLFDPAVMIEELEQGAASVLDGARGALEGAMRDLDFLRLDAASFGKAPRISIDYAVMEKTRRAGVVRARFGWSDIGAWNALYDVLPRDASGNVVEGPVSLAGTKGSLVRADGILTAVVGISDAVVVATPDAVLVTTRERAGEVKGLVAQLHSEGREEAGQHRRIHRPWGWYQRIDIGTRFQVKQICVHPGARLSLQKHFHRAEHWIVVQGTAEVTIDATVKLVHENEAAYLPIGCTHRLHNPGKIELRLIEVQVGSYTGEDDIVRVEDVYART